MPFFWNNEGLNPNAVVGSSRRNLAFTSVLSNGTTMVSVFCPSPHGLTRLDIIAIYGLSDINANGFYYVSEVTSDTSFTYETLYPAIGGPLQTENTILFNANIGVPYGYIKVPYIASSVGYPPVNTIPPVITDTCVNTGTWTGTQPIIYTYQWYLDGVAISGATAQCSVTGNSVVVTATNACGSASVTASSVCTPPSILIYPVITETCVNTGTWLGTEPITYTYQWYLDGVAIPGATSQCSVTGNSVDVTATNACGSASVTAYSGPAGWNTSLYEFKYLPLFVDTESIRLGLNSNIYIFSMNRSSGEFYDYPIVTKFDFISNSIEWNKYIGDGSISDSSGGWSPNVMCSNEETGDMYILTGNFFNSPAFAVLTRIDENGNLTLRKKFTSIDEFQYLATDGIKLTYNNSHLIFVGQHDARCLLVKTDLSGNIIYKTSYQIDSLTANGAEWTGIANTLSAHTYVVYKESASETQVNFKVNSGFGNESGGIEWANKFNYSLPMFGTGDYRFITSDNVNSLIQCINEANNNEFCYLVKQNSDGNIIFQKKLSPQIGTGFDRIYLWDVTTDVVNNIYICGFIDNTDERYRSIGIIMKYDQNGNLLWCNGVYDPYTNDSELELDGIQVYQDKVLCSLWLLDNGRSTSSMVKLAQDGSGIGNAIDYLDRTIVYNDISQLISSETTDEITVEGVALTSQTAGIEGVSYNAPYGDFSDNGFDFQQFLPPATSLLSPVNTIPPVITNTCVNTGTWTGDLPITYTYQWYLDGVEISGDTSQCSTTGNSVIVTASNAYGVASITVYAPT